MMITASPRSYRLTLAALSAVLAAGAATACSPGDSPTGDGVPVTAIGGTASPLGEASSPAAGSISVPVVDRWVKAVNAGDVNAFHGTFGPNPVVVDSGRTFTGLDQIDGWSSNELIGAGGRITVRSEEPSASGTTLNVTFASQVYNGPGRYVFTVDSGRITRIDMVPPTT